MTEDTDIRDLKTTLEAHIGLSPYETDVYLTLVRSGRQSMARLAEASGVPQQRIYDVIQDLHERGFVEVVDGYPKEAYANDPDTVLSPVQDRLESAQTTLDALHQTVEDVKGGVSTFTSESMSRRYLSRVVEAADYNLFVLAPRETLTLLHDVLPLDTEVDTHLIISGLPDENLSGEGEWLSAADRELADEIHGVTFDEALVVSADRKRGLFWPGASSGQLTTDSPGYYVTNPELALMFDRFLMDSIWPQSTQLKPEGEETTPTFPVTHIRIRDCLDDLQTAARMRPLESFEVSFDGYEIDSREHVRLRGTVVDYHYSKYDAHSSIELEVTDEDTTRRTVTVGGWRSVNDDYEARRLTLYGPTGGALNCGLDDTTQQHLRQCRKALPEAFGGGTFAVGFDGAIDHMKQIVAERTGATTYEPMSDFETLQDYLGQASTAARSPFVEWVETSTLVGGHSVNTGSVPAMLGNDVSFVGMYGQPILDEFTERFPDQRLVSIGEPSRGDLIQFTDGKVILTEGGVHSTLDWESLCQAATVDTIVDIFNDATHVSIGSWATFPRLPTILDGIQTEVWPRLNSPPEALFFMSGDINRFADAKFPAGITAIAALNDVVPVTVFATWRQVAHYARVCGEDTTNSLVRLTESVYDRLGVARLIVHTPQEAILTTGSGTIVVQTPVVDDSEELKNAEDHFAGGFAAAQMEGLDGGPSLIVANAVAHFFTQHQREPTATELREALSTYDQIKQNESDN